MSAALNAICPYFTMYPLDFPLRVLRQFGQPGDWVIDPFCGRGTTNFAARLLQMPSFGVDSSPVAAALGQAKLASANVGDIVAEARSILAASRTPCSIPQGEFWQLAYHEVTLVQICQLREALLEDCGSSTRILLRAILLGALHGPRPKGVPSYLSNQSPRTFAPKPRYAVKFWNERGMRPVEVDLIAIVSVRADRYLTVSPPSVEGQVRLADSRDAAAFYDIEPARLVVTSPPYYGMRTYLPDQWLRVWFMGGPETVVYRYSAHQLEHTGAQHFAREMGLVWKNVAQRTTPDARLIIRYGGINDRDANPMDVLKTSLVDTGWKMVTARAVPDADTGRRQVRQFQATPRKGITEYDVYCHTE